MIIENWSKFDAISLNLMKLYNMWISNNLKINWRWDNIYILLRAQLAEI